MILTILSSCLNNSEMLQDVYDAKGRRVSDRLITVKSRILDKLDPGDTVLADRGFTIKSDLLLRQVNLAIPPPATGLEQMTQIDVKNTHKKSCQH